MGLPYRRWTSDTSPGKSKPIGVICSDSAILNVVNKVYFMIGAIDFIVNSKLADRNIVGGLVTRLEVIDEIYWTSSQFVITTVKDTTHPLTAHPVDSLTDLCSDS